MLVESDWQAGGQCGQRERGGKQEGRGLGHEDPAAKVGPWCYSRCCQRAVEGFDRRRT